MAMQVIYEKDTVSHWTIVTEPGVQKIRLFADTLGQMKEIRRLHLLSVGKTGKSRGIVGRLL